MLFDRALERMPIADLKPAKRNARTHSEAQIAQIAASMERFGVNNPALIDDEGRIIAGHGRIAAARKLGLTEFPCLRLSHLSEAEKQAYVLADNKLALNAGWDKELLAIDLRELTELQFDVILTGFTMPEIDLILAEVDDASPDVADPDDAPIEPASSTAITQIGDLWVLGRPGSSAAMPRIQRPLRTSSPATWPT